MKFKVILSLLLIVIAGLIIFQLYYDPEPADTADRYPHEFRNLHDSVKYIGMQTCRGCHEDIYQSFKKTGMGQSFHKATREKSAGNFENHAPVYDPYLDFYYYPHWENETMKLTEFRLNDDGDTTFKRTETIDYIIGSGHHTNSHLMEVNGYIYQIPVTWYAQEERWDLPPGYEDGNNTRFERIIGIECMSCHNARPDFDFNSSHRFHNVPMGIDCESCHGPGELHVLRIQEEGIGSLGNDTDHTIVNPAKLPLDFQIDVCQRCHLQGNAVPQIGKDFLDFRPGMRLHEVMDVFLPRFEDSDEKFIMASHAERMRQSPCYTETRPGGKFAAHESIDQLNCITCHNPHISVELTQKQHFIQTCQGCHDPIERNCTEDIEVRKMHENNCADCHMPRSGTIDIPHVSITDHFIRIPREDTQYTHQHEDMARGAFLGLQNMTRDETDPHTMARAYLLYYERFEARPALLDSAHHYLRQIDTTTAINTFVYFHYLSGNYNDVAALTITYEKQLRPAARTWYQAGQSFFNLNDPDGARHYFSKAVELEPRNPEYREKLATAYMFMNERELAKEELLTITRENPNKASAHNNLAFIFLEEQNPGEAGKHIEKALALNPDYISALVNRAKLELMEYRYEDALQTAESILKLEPGHPEASQIRTIIRRELP